jgi:DNA helicase-2/ATP-dependent DNA helicase PcrA
MATLHLNEFQKKAIEHGDGPLLIIAGAGTGKTTVITERIKYLIQKKKISPEHILALTFTEKAAAEMEDRIDRIMPYGYTQMWISTFHSFCDQVLRQDGLQIGLNPNFKLISEAESVQLFKKNLFKLKLDYYRPLGNPTKFIEALLTHYQY